MGPPSNRADFTNLQIGGIEGSVFGNRRKRFRKRFFKTGIDLGSVFWRFGSSIPSRFLAIPNSGRERFIDRGIAIPSRFLGDSFGIAILERVRRGGGRFPATLLKSV